MSLFPLTPLLPPGLLFFFVYRRWWKRARFLRAERDMVRLPLRHFPEFTGAEPDLVTLLPNGDELSLERWRQEGALERLGEGKIRRVSRLEKRALEEEGCYIFGRREASMTELVAARDPMVELVLIPGNPVALSQECSREARRFELLSAAALSVGILMNLVLVFWVLVAIVR